MPSNRLTYRRRQPYTTVPNKVHVKLSESGRTWKPFLTCLLKPPLLPLRPHHHRVASEIVKTPSNRLTYRWRQPYTTACTKVRVIKDPGGKLKYLLINKTGTTLKCGDCGMELAGIPVLGHRRYATIFCLEKTVQRTYGNSRYANCVKVRVARAFLTEEQKIVKKVMKEAERKNKK